MIVFTLNGKPQEIDADPQKPLLWVLRDDIGLVGTKFGCGEALCGACTVHVDGEPTRSCQTRIGDIAGKNVVTIEGVKGDVAQAVQKSWIKLDVPQCGYCQSGQVMAAIGLLSTNKKPSDSEIDDAMSGNLCRCCTYARIRAAVHEASRLLGA
ncbi:(2Fe-2S)-binding protein [Rhodoblastus acidophilus]|uniref:(2Fe-2S)-binding protein n=1 Tax=Candidatus Rhodoblastus alkanivorans TaxID=2954117 RepID=A0ABS9Z7M9_9HYPH|nr:(2Fe-2S)-binding protein [Candidatus Rhodoblastus alkanivorans]MCI4680806.1 (2Fe-2S)-binding protein [Candidatus Rhodoblastus alkanivorans]MCI4683648.1 (2Fe-2S)-binding protein [Candidatus Rhodoblastus alkanivorans]MDI4640964.1 (2Fe-2S)-binding protein [Rhodoblastus acidophilus]